MSQARRIFSRMQFRRGGRAFTFVEILATLALVGVVLPTVMSGLSLSLSTADYATRQAQASALAQSKLMELVAQNQWQQVNLSGDFSPQHPEYRWSAQVSDWSGSSTLDQVDLTITWSQQDKERTLVLSTLVKAGVTP